MNLVQESVAAAKLHYEEIDFELVAQAEMLRAKQENLDATKHGGELHTVWMMDSWDAVESLERKENELVDHRANRHHLDTSIISLYLKILSMQSSRIHTYLKKLEYYIEKNPDQECPPDYAVSDYNTWTRTDPALHAIQSEILDLLSQRIRLNTNTHDAGHLKKIRNKLILKRRETLRNVDLQKLRSKSHFFIEQDPYVDSEFSSFVTKVVRPESNSFESRKIIDFIHQCWNYFEHDDLKGHVLYPYCSPQYQEFLCAMSEHILNKYGHMRKSTHSKSAVTYDQIFAILEGYLLPNIYECVMSQVRSPKDDQKLAEKYETCREFLQKDFHIKAEYQDTALCPYQQAILKLKALQAVKLPTQKLRAIILAAQETMKYMNVLCSDPEKVAGADEFMDVWVYVTLKAGIRDLATQINMLKEYCNPSIMMSETGYYLSSLELAAEFIKTMPSTKVDTDVGDGAEVYFLVAEEEKFMRLANLKSSWFDVVEKNISLPGYEVVTIFEWLNDPHKLLTSFFSPRIDSLISATLCKVKPYFANKSLQNMLLTKFNLEQGFVTLQESSYGRIPVIDTTVFNSRMETLHLVFIQNDAQLSLTMAQRCLTYMRICCISQPLIDILEGKISTRTQEEIKNRCKRISVTASSDEDQAEMLRQLNSVTDLLNEKQIFSNQSDLLRNWSSKQNVSFNEMKNLLLALKQILLNHCFSNANEGSTPFDDIVITWVKSLQRLVKDCGLYSTLLPTDGLFSSYLFKQVLILQKHV